MNRRNYAKELDRIIEKNQGKKPTLLLHACCGPCSTSVLEKLVDNFQVTILWYNPNIYPEEEFNKRLATLHEVVEKLGIKDIITIQETPWRHEEYDRVVVGLEKEPEGGARCTKCFELRLAECAKICKEQNFDYFCTTLTVSRHKDAVRINAIGETVANKVGARWLPSDFKKRDGENRSVKLSEKLGIYRQLYCGCIYSLQNRENYLTESKQ